MLQFLAIASFQIPIPVLVGGALQTTDVTAAMALFYIQSIILVSEVLFVCLFLCEASAIQESTTQL